MRRGIVFLIMLILVWAGQSVAMMGPFGWGGPDLMLKGGYYLTSEEKIDDGLIFGLGLGTAFDDNITLGLEFDYFGKTFDGKVAVEDTSNPLGYPVSGNVKNFEHHSRLFPMMATLRVTPALTPGMLFKPYFGAGIGYSLMHISYDFKDSGSPEDKDSEMWGGVSWELMAGAKNKLGPRSTLLLELSYRDCKVKETRDEVIDDRVREVEYEIDMSGWGFWAGILLKLF